MNVAHDVAAVCAEQAPGRRRANAASLRVRSRRGIQALPSGRGLPDLPARP